MPRERTLLPTIVGLLAAVLVGAFVLTSGLVATQHAFRFEGQLPALLPFFVWAAAAGVGHLANLGRTLLAPWRAAWGYVSLVPYAVLMIAVAVVPGLQLPWWTAAIAAACAAGPFIAVGLRSDPTLAVTPVRDADDTSLRGTFLTGVALMLLAYAVSGPPVTGAIMSVLLAVGLAIASMMTHGMARASRTWRMRHWLALTWGSLVIWISALLRGLTTFFDDVWFVFTVVILAGIPLIVINSAEARRSGQPRPAEDASAPHQAP